MINRKLVRPNLAEMKERFSTNRAPQSPAETAPAEPVAPRDQNRRRQVPPENTSAEAFYYVKQMTNHTPMVVMLDNGDQLRGHIEWYDRNCIKVNREGAPNLLVYKHAIKFMYKQEEETPGA
jgi:host factor-I protein